MTKNKLTTAEMSLGALSCEYVMDVWRVWHFLLLLLLLLTLLEEAAAASSAVAEAAAHVLKRTRSSAAPAADQGPLLVDIGEGIIWRIVWV